MSYHGQPAGLISIKNVSNSNTILHLVIIVLLMFIPCSFNLLSAQESIIKKFYNYPNPFKKNIESTHIVYELTQPASGFIKIYDLSGNLVWENTIAVTAANVTAAHTCNWNGRTKAGDMAVPGVYICRLSIKVSDISGSISESKTIKIGVK